MNNGLGAFSILVATARLYCPKRVTKAHFAGERLARRTVNFRGRVERRRVAVRRADEARRLVVYLAAIVSYCGGRGR